TLFRSAGTALFGATLPASFTLHMVMRSEEPATVLVGPDTADVDQFELPGGTAVAVRCERRAGGDEPLPDHLRFHVAGGPVEVLSMEGYEMLPPRPETGSTEREEFTDPDTGARIVRLTHSCYEDKHAYYDVDPWSPDGSRILFCSALPAQRDSSIWTMDADGGNIRKVGEGSSFGYHCGNFPLWAPDGQSVYWHDSREIDGERTSGTVRHFLGDGREQFLPFGVRQVSPQGLLLDTVSNPEVAPCGLYLSDADGTNRRLLASTDAILALSPSRELAAEQGLRLNLQNCKWNADGSRCFVVFCGRDERGAAQFVEVFSMNADGSELTFSCSIAHHPIWHPDGEHILFNAGDGMYLVRWDGTDLRKVSDCNVGHPSFSRDGSMIVTDGYGAEWGDALWLIDPETGATTKLCTVPTVHGRSHERGTHPHPVWSPDGRSILYDSDQTGHCQLYQVFVPK
ncbi:MAG: TolB family protein, partial [Armatimonadota bacterium]